MITRIMNLPVRGITAVKSPYSCGNEREFYSEADYWYPNPDNPAGEYICRDGESNPDCFNCHRKLLMRLSCIVPTLGKAFLQSSKKELLDKLQDHLKIWFTDESISMLPHLEYSQAIRNRVPGRSFGVIDTIHLAEVALTVSRLRHVLPTEQVASVTEWFGQYLNWLRTSQLGIAERTAHNNHAVCWYLQAAAFAKLIADEESLEEFRNDFKNTLLEQIAGDGTLPLELQRTKPYGYELFTLEAFAGLAALLSTKKENFFLLRKGDGGSVRDAVEFMYPFIADKKSWPYRSDVQYFDYWPCKQSALYLASHYTEIEKYRELWYQLPNYSFKFELVRNYPVRNPEFWIF